GETNKVGSVAVLVDSDGDGKMDQRTVFLDGLVMPRALALLRGGALVAEPANLWFCQDTDGDGRCDKKTLIANDYAPEADPQRGRAQPATAQRSIRLAHPRQSRRQSRLPEGRVAPRRHACHIHRRLRAIGLSWR